MFKNPFVVSWKIYLISITKTMKNMNAPRGKTAQPFNVKSGGTYSNRSALHATLKVVRTLSNGQPTRSFQCSQNGPLPKAFGWISSM
jgi:hypothetical protein